MPLKNLETPIKNSRLLYELNESIVMPEEVVKNIKQLRNIGEEKFKSFLEKRVNSQSEALTDVIKKVIFNFLENHLIPKNNKKTTSFGCRYHQLL